MLRLTTEKQYYFGPPGTSHCIGSSTPEIESKIPYLKTFGNVILVLEMFFNLNFFSVVYIKVDIL